MRRYGKPRLGTQEEKAREIIDEAVKTAETKKREVMFISEGRIHSCEERSDKEVKRTPQRFSAASVVAQKEENLDAA